MTLPWVIIATIAGLAAGPLMRASVLHRSIAPGQEPCRACPACDRVLLPARRPWRWLPATGRCPSCHSRIGPFPLLVEAAAALSLAIVAARASTGWELAALAWLAVLAVPLAFIDVAVSRLPDRLTIPALAGTLALLTVAALASRQPGHLIRALLGAVALAGFYLLLMVIRPGGMGLGDVKLAASAGLVLGWLGWPRLLAATFLTFLLTAALGLVLIVAHRADRKSYLPFGPFILVGVLAAVAL